jgi:hypothetical protein
MSQQVTLMVFRLCRVYAFPAIAGDHLSSNVVSARPAIVRQHKVRYRVSLSRTDRGRLSDHTEAKQLHPIYVVFWKIWSDGTNHQMILTRRCFGGPMNLTPGHQASGSDH